MPCVQGITDLINVPGLINLDFADVKTVMKDKGIAHIGIGVGNGDVKCMDVFVFVVGLYILLENKFSPCCTGFVPVC